MKKFLLVVFCSIAGFAFATEYTVQTIPNPKTTNVHAYVSNPDGILKMETVQELNFMLDSLEIQTGAEVAIVAVNSIGQADYFTFSTSLFDKWKIGKEKQNNGLLVLFVLDQRKLMIEPGYGLEGILPDGVCSKIRTQTMNPEFRKGNYDAGLLSGVKQICSIIRKEPVPGIVESPVAWNEILPIAIGIYLILILITWVWMANSIGKIRKNSKLPNNIARYKAIKSEKSGMISLVSLVLPIIGFVCILFFSKAIYLLLIIPVPFTTIPANIYAIIMMLKARRAPITCNECGGKMHILSEKKEDSYLKVAQQFEEQLHAIDYDVFVCDNCKNQAIFTLDKPSAYSVCPKCGTKAFILKEKRTTIAPTYISAGTEKITYHCKFCGYEENHNDNIPRLQRNGGAFVAGAVAGSLFSGRGGFGDGGSFSGGDFGGGMTGGGGSGGGW